GEFNPTNEAAYLDFTGRPFHPECEDGRVTARKIIIDCDPGIDDALALVYAHGHPGLALAGLTTVAGNVSLDKTTANALRIRDFFGLAGVPVVAGSPGPLL